MGTFLLFIFLLIIMIKKLFTYCFTANYENIFCFINIFCYENKYRCKELNCANSRICDGTYQCETCISNYHIYNGQISCLNSQTNNLYSEPEIENICHPYCQSCYSSATYESMNCISCKENFHKLNGTNNCFDDSLKDEGFYFKNNFFYPCDENCQTCSLEKIKN